MRKGRMTLLALHRVSTNLLVLSTRFQLVRVKAVKAMKNQSSQQLLTWNGSIFEGSVVL
jgi:hypothetical protein